MKATLTKNPYHAGAPQMIRNENHVDWLLHDANDHREELNVEAGYLELQFVFYQLKSLPKCLVSCLLPHFLLTYK